MSSKIQLYFFECGTLKCEKHLITMNRGIGEPFEIPVPFFLIKHPKANILFDLGNALPVAKNPEQHWGDVVNAYFPVMTEEQYVVNQLKNVGVKPEDIDYVVLSHLHLDHAGAVGEFPNATYIAQREELKWAYVHDFYQKGAYIRADFDRDVKWLLLDGEADDGYDILGDGTVTICFTPGHTPGHQSLVVRLENSGTFFLAADACYTEETLNEDVLPGLVWSPPHTVKSIQKMRYAQNTLGTTIITGHDPDTWPKYRLAPEFYD